MEEITSFVSTILFSTSSSDQCDDGLILRHSKLATKLGLEVNKPLEDTANRSISLQGRPPFATINDSSRSLARCNANGGRRRELRSLVLNSVSRVIGVCGVEGVGKTTLARHVSEEISPQFQYYCFLNEFTNKRIQRQDTKLNLLEMVASDEFFKQSRSVDAIKDMITHQKVLLLIDGVDVGIDVKSITKDASWFGPGSKIIIITQEKSLLTDGGVKHIYEVECPRYDEAVSLFSEFLSSKETLFLVSRLSRFGLSVSRAGFLWHSKCWDHFYTTGTKMNG